ncbi:uroplakin-3b [Polyodon spathula]|uniref:uroplakin-3b n=1 Tax=Polyodon spathula TaxID=7913 RepID=UPI001B7DBBCB|nr:uroplakin-3b [Polyodon spathula]
MALLLSALFVCVSFCTVNGQIQVPYVPGITPYNLPGRVTASTFSLKMPLCYFNQTLTGCTAAQCEIWLVVARNATAQTLFDAIKGNILNTNVNSYQNAFTNPGTFFLTKVGTQQSFVCDEPTTVQVFRVGSDTTCTALSPTCNGPLPPNADLRVKYVLIDPIISKKVEVESQWSQPILLTQVKTQQSIDEGFGKRSGAMIVITVILTCLTAMLLFGLITAVILPYCGVNRGKQEITAPTSLGSLRVKRYNTHNVHSPTTSTAVTNPNI